jgi:tetratricopeptide (TPR) repeat protein
MSPQALFARGQALFALGDHERAEQYITLAVRSGFPEERAIVPLTRACVAASRLRAALDHATPFLRRHPDAWELRYLVAAIRWALGHATEARAELQRLIARKPEAAQPHYLLGVIERDAFRDERAARASFSTYAALEPHGVFAPEVLAWLDEHPNKEAP